MPFYDDFRSRLRTDVPRPDTAAGKEGYGELLNLARMSDSVAKALNTLTKEQLAYYGLLEKTRKTSKSANDNLSTWIDLLVESNKLDVQRAKTLKDTIKAELESFRQEERTLRQTKDRIAQQQTLLELEKRYHQTEFQMRRDALRNVQEQFWGPMTNMFKASGTAAFTRDLSLAMKNMSTQIMREAYTLSRTTNQVILSGLGDQVRAFFAKAATSYGSEIFKSIGESIKGVREGFKEGREAYFRRQEQRILNREERVVGKFDHAVTQYSLLHDRISAKWEYMIRAGHKFIDRADQTINHGHHGSGSFAATAGMPKVGGGFQNFATRASGFASGLIGSFFNLVPVASNLLSSAIRELNEIASLGASTLVEYAVARRDFQASFAREFGPASKVYMGGALRIVNYELGLDFQKTQEYFASIVRSYGSIVGMTQDQLKYQVQLGDAYMVSADESGKYFKVLDSIGMTSVKDLEKFRANVTTFATKEGASSKEIMRDIARNTSWIAMVGSKRMLENFAKSASQIKSMGVSIDAMLKASDNFESFDAAAENAFKLNAALGTRLDPVRMHIAAMQGDVKTIQDNIFAAMREIPTLNAMQVKAAAQALGMSNEEVRNLHEGLRTRRMMSDASFNLGQLGGATNATMTKIMGNLGIAQKDQGEYAMNRVAAIFGRHKSDYGSFDSFSQALVSQNAVGKNLRQELFEAVKMGEKQVSVPGLLQQMLTNEQAQHAKRLAVAQAMSGTLNKMNSIQSAINIVLLKLLDIGVHVVTPMAAGILKFFGLSETSKLVSSIGKGFESVLKDPTVIQAVGGGDKMSSLFTNIGERDRVIKELDQLGTKGYWSEMYPKMKQAIFEGVKDAFIFLGKHPLLMTAVGGLALMKSLPLLSAIGGNGGLFSGLLNKIGIGGTVGGLGLGYGALNVANALSANATEKDTRKAYGSGIGAVAGGILGSIVPGLGTLAGSGAGSVLGGIIAGGFKSDAERAQESLVEQIRLGDSQVGLMEHEIERRKDGLDLTTQEIQHAKALYGNGKLSLKGKEQEATEAITHALGGLQKSLPIAEFDALKAKLFGPNGFVSNLSTAIPQIETAAKKAAENITKATGDMLEFQKAKQDIDELQTLITTGQENAGMFSASQMGDMEAHLTELKKQVYGPSGTVYADLMRMLTERGIIRPKVVSAMSQFNTYDYDDRGNLKTSPTGLPLKDPTLGWKKKSHGGRVFGPGGPHDDLIPAFLSDGEFIMNSGATARHLSLLQMLNARGYGGGSLLPIEQADGPTGPMTESQRALINRYRKTEIDKNGNVSYYGGKGTPANDAFSQLTHNPPSYTKKGDRSFVDALSTIGLAGPSLGYNVLAAPFKGISWLADKALGTHTGDVLNAPDRLMEKAGGQYGHMLRATQMAGGAMALTKIPSEIAHLMNETKLLREFSEVGIAGQALKGASMVTDLSHVTAEISAHMTEFFRQNKRVNATSAAVQAAQQHDIDSLTKSMRELINLMRTSNKNVNVYLDRDKVGEANLGYLQSVSQ